MKIIFNKTKDEKGFTIIELLVSIAIFAIMTALILVKYGKFNQGTLLTNLAYDVALTIRNAQSYGLNVKSATRTTNQFQYAYGVNFDTTNNTTQSQFIFFVDLYEDGIYNLTDSDSNGAVDEFLSKTLITRGSKVNKLCVGHDFSNNLCTDGTVVNKLNISFKRPDPSAIIMGEDSGGGTQKYNFAEIIMSSSDGVAKKIQVNSTGQISVLN